MILEAPDEELLVGVLRLVIYVPGSRSLKDKRRALHSVRDRLAHQRHFAVAEVGHLEDRQRAVLAVTTVSNDARVIESGLDRLRYEINGWGVVIVEDAESLVIRPFDLEGA